MTSEQAKNKSLGILLRRRLKTEAVMKVDADDLEAARMIISSMMNIALDERRPVGGSALLRALSKPIVIR